MDEKNMVKSAIEEIRPDPYMKTRLSANVIEQTAPKKAYLWKRTAAALLVFVLVLGGAGGFYQHYNHNNIMNTLPPTTNNSISDFAIIAYASDDTDQKTTVELSENNISLIDMKIKVYKDFDGVWTFESSSTAGFEINADNLKSVTFKSEMGNFSYYDAPLRIYQEKTGEYYAAKIPLTDEENEEYQNQLNTEGIGRNYQLEFLTRILNSRDCSQYFSGDIAELDKYSIIYSDKEDMDNLNQLCLVDMAKIRKELMVKNQKEFTAKTYSDDDTISWVYYNPDEIGNYLIENPQTKFSELPADNIYITVKFKSGESVTKQLKVTFNDDGMMQLEYVH